MQWRSSLAAAAVAVSVHTSTWQFGEGASENLQAVKYLSMVTHSASFSSILCAVSVTDPQPHCVCVFELSGILKRSGDVLRLLAAI